VQHSRIVETTVVNGQFELYLVIDGVDRVFEVSDDLDAVLANVSSIFRVPVDEVEDFVWLYNFDTEEGVAGPDDRRTGREISDFKSDKDGKVTLGDLKPANWKDFLFTRQHVEELRHRCQVIGGIPCDQRTLQDFDLEDFNRLGHTRVECQRVLNKSYSHLELIHTDVSLVISLDVDSNDLVKVEWIDHDGRNDGIGGPVIHLNRVLLETTLIICTKLSPVYTVTELRYGDSASERVHDVGRSGHG